MKKLLLVVLSCAIGIAATALSGEKVFNMRLATEVNPENHVAIAINDAADEIRERTGGKVDIKVYPGGMLGSYTAVYTQVMTGDIDMSVSYLEPNYDPRRNLLLFPALVEGGFEGFKETMFPGTYLFDLMTKIENDVNIHIFSVCNGGMMCLGLAKPPKETFGELVEFHVKKDPLMRIPPMDVYSVLMSEWGFRTTTIGFADLYPALQSGVADGWVGGSPLLNWDSFRDVINCIVDVQIINEIMPVLINMDLYKSLPEEYREIMTEVFLKMAYRIADEREGQEQQALKNFEEAGVKVIRGTDEERKKLYHNVRTYVWPKLKDLVGEDLLKEVAAQYGIEVKF